MRKGYMGTAKALAAVGIAVLSAGCATVVRGTREDVSIVSEPAGAQAKTSQGVACVTPCVLHPERKTAFNVTIWKEGYEPQTVLVKPELAGAGAAGLAGNVIIGGVIGAGVDVVSGAALDLKPNPIIVTLLREPSPTKRGREPVRPLGPPPFPPRPEAEEMQVSSNDRQ